MRLLGRLLVLVVVVIGLIIAGIFLLPGDRLGQIASEQLSRQLGRDVVIGGDVGITIWPTLGVSTGALRVANAPGFSSQPMFEADGATIGVDAQALLSGNVQVKSLVAARPRILLQEDASGKGNWEFASSGETGSAAASESSASSSPVSSITIEQLKITDASFRYERAGETPIAYDNVDLAMRWPAMAGPADIDVSLQPAGAPVRFVGRISSPVSYLNGGAHPLSGTITAGGGTVVLDGKASIAPEYQGALRVNLPKTSSFLAALGLGQMDLPEGAGRSVEAQAQMTYQASGALALRGLKATLDHHTLAGDVDLALGGAKPRINANLTTGPLKLAQDSTGGESGGSGWSKERIDASGVGALDGDILLSAPSITVGDLNFGATRILTSIDRARAVFDIRELRAYGGNLTGEFVINNRNGLSVGGNLNAAGVDAKSLLTAMGMTDRLDTTANARLKFLGVGESMDQIVRSLSGDGGFDTTAGRISGIDLDSLVREGGAGGGTTLFDDMAATFTINEGVLRNNDMLFTLPDFRADGEGKVDLGRQTIDYTILPNSLNARGGEGLIIPVTIKGPWSDPKIDADFAAALELSLEEEKRALEERLEREKELAREALEKEKKKAEERVRDQINDKLEDEIGVRVEEGENLEDKLREKIEDEAKKGLLRLLGQD